MELRVNEALADEPLVFQDKADQSDAAQDNAMTLHKMTFVKNMVGVLLTSDSIDR